MKLTRALIVSIAVSMLAVPALAAQPETANPGLSPALQHAITPVRGGSVAGIPAFAKPGSTGGTNNGISYRGGAVMTSGVNVYLIWYGSWSDATKRGLITNFINNIGGSSYYNINTTYYDGSKTKVSSTVKLLAQAYDAYSQGSSNLSNAQIGTIVSDAITNNSWALDTNGLYFVLTSADVTKQGFLTSYCGWHTYGTMNSKNIKYSFVGNPGTNMNCSAQSASPNGDMGVDAMISVMAHELEETATDPELNAWYDSTGKENADKCAWKFGATSTASNGSAYNMTIGGKNYLVQQNWVNASGGYCAMSY